MSIAAVDLNKTSFGRIFLVSVIIFSMVLGPFWHIYDLHPKLFFKLDISRLTVLCLAISFPMILLGGILTYGIKETFSKRMDEDMDESEEAYSERILLILVDGSFVVMMAFSFTSLIQYVTKKHFPLPGELIIGCLILFTSVVLGISKIERKQKAGKVEEEGRTVLSEDEPQIKPELKNGSSA